MKQQKDAENLTAAGNCTDKPTRIKSTGIIRRVDELGRIVIPMSIRQTLGLNERDPVLLHFLRQYGRSDCLRGQKCMCGVPGGSEPEQLRRGGDSRLAERIRSAGSRAPLI